MTAERRKQTSNGLSHVMRLRYWIAPIAALVLIAAGWFVVRSGFVFRRAPVELTILALNDFHGYLQPPPGGIRVDDPSDKSKKDQRPRRRRRTSRDAGEGAAQKQEAQHLRRRRRPDRRKPVPVRAVPRRADHRVAVDHGPRHHLRRQSRVRRGRCRAHAHAEGRLPSDRRLQGPASVPWRKIQIPRRQHHREGDRQAVLSRL